MIMQNILVKKKRKLKQNTKQRNKQTNISSWIQIMELWNK